MVRMYAPGNEDMMKVRKSAMMNHVNALTLAHRFLREQIREGSFCIDATAGRGGDTLLLAQLVGESGRVLAFDIQREAVESTRTRLEEAGLSHRVQVIEESHNRMAQYAGPGTVDGIVFNFGFLPGGDHSIFTTPVTSIPALEQGLSLLKVGGVMSLCIYYGGDTGFEERDALLSFLEGVDPKRFTVLLCRFANRPNCPPMAAFITKDSD